MRHDPRRVAVETDVPNAFVVGLDPDRSSLVVTRGLLSLLTPREMEGVLAHEISHIGNKDIRVPTRRQFPQPPTLCAI